jgi:molecular chaperone GrpE
MGKSRKIKIEIDDEKHTEEKPEEVFDTVADETELGDDELEDGNEEVPEDELAKARREASDNYDRLLRVSAEFENYKKRTSREMSEFRKYANEALIKDLLGVVDNLERAINSAAESEDVSDSLVTGIEMTLKDILKILEKYNVTSIECIGEPFDPEFHQAVMQESVTDQPANIILKELQKGYMIHDRLLRPSMVVVSKVEEKAG